MNDSTGHFDIAAYDMGTQAWRRYFDMAAIPTGRVEWCHLHTFVTQEQNYLVDVINSATKERNRETAEQVLEELTKRLYDNLVKCDRKAKSAQREQDYELPNSSTELLRRYTRSNMEHEKATCLRKEGTKFGSDNQTT